MNSQQEQAVRSLPHVRWLGIYQPSYRISQGALNKTFTVEQDQEKGETSYETLRITVFPGEDLNKINSQIAALGGTILDTVTTKWKTTLKIKAPVNRISDLTLIQGVKWVEPVPEWKLFNNVSTDIMTVRTPRNSHGLYGEGQTVGVCDTGLDQGSTNPASLHDDFEDGSGSSRVTQIIDVAGDGPQDVNSGHGTHVAGSVLGNGILSGSTPSSNTFPDTCFSGIAPKASLVFQAVENNTTEGLYLPSDLNTLFSQSDSAGADLHTNSWGDSVGGMYSSYSQDVDEYIWDNKDFLILFSAGNSGIDKDGDGVIDLFSLGAPATAKNCLTVGASEGYRPSGAGYDFNWGVYHPYKFSATPISTDHVSNNSVGMAAFSSRGPVIDGRYKPDLVAPGTNILSTKSSATSQTGWGAYNTYYTWMGGTSMSTPLTAGASALMREYLIKEQDYTNPSAALIKAALLNSAEDISPGQYGTGVDQEIPDAPVPNNVEGWGRLNIENGVYPSSPFNILYYDEPTGLNTGGNQEYTVDVSAVGSPLKINLVWTDYPGSTPAQGGLVNDLDLQVTDPSMSVHYPDNASQKSTVSQITYDDGSNEFTYNSNKLAVKFAPSAYPANIESTSFYFSNPLSTSTDVDVVVYDDDGTGGLPGTQLFRKTLTYVPTGWITIGITGVVINSGEFYIAIEKNDLNQRLLQDYPDSTGRSYYDSGSGWAVDTGYMTYIRANVRGTDHSTSFDRVNNVLGLTLDSAAGGTYTIRVSGYNVPQGPQPYALVVSGRVPDTDPPSIVEYPNINFDNNTIDVAYDEPGMQNATVETNYSFSPLINFSTLSPTGDDIANLGGSTYRLSMASIPEYEIYTLTVTTNITDLAGNPVDPLSIRINDNEGDNMADDWETGHGLNPTVDDSADDLDSDGYTNYQEYLSRTDPSSANSLPIAITDSTPQHNAGIANSTHVPNNSSFAVMIRSAQGIDLTDTTNINFTINDGVNPSYGRNLGSAFVRTINLTGDPNTQVTSLWAVYDRSLDVFGNYNYDVDVNVTVDAIDRNAISMITASYVFNIESLDEHSAAQANLPDTSTVIPADPDLVGDPDRDTGTQVDSGDLEGARILYDSIEPIEPYFGPLDEVPAINLSGTNSVAVPMNLQPPTVFDTPVKLFIPCPGYSDVSGLSVYYYNGEDWVRACNANGDVLSEGEGWMVPGSRVDHNNGSPSTIEIQVYHFSGAQTGFSSASPPPADGGGGSSGGGCFISTATFGL